MPLRQHISSNKTENKDVVFLFVFNNKKSFMRWTGLCLEGILILRRYNLKRSECMNKKISIFVEFLLLFGTRKSLLLLKGCVLFLSNMELNIPVVCS